MVKLENIRKDGNVICVDCYAEERDYFYLEINAENFEILVNSANEMNSYVFHAIHTIKKYVDAGEKLPSSALSVWY